MQLCVQLNTTIVMCNKNQMFPPTVPIYPNVFFANVTETHLVQLQLSFLQTMVFIL